MAEEISEHFLRETKTLPTPAFVAAISSDD